MSSIIPKETMALAIKYVPEGVPDPRAYIELVMRQTLGVDKDNRVRPVEDLIYFLQVSKMAGLDPMLKQIYAVYRWNSTQGREVMSIQTGIDGLRLVAEKTGAYAGSDDAVFETNKEGEIIKATVTVYKLNAKTGERMPFTASARWNEYVQVNSKGEPTTMWRKMPYLMLGKVAESLALRKAFPNTSQLYTPEEMAQADSPIQYPTPKKRETPTVETAVSEADIAQVVDSIVGEN